MMYYEVSSPTVQFEAAVVLTGALHSVSHRFFSMKRDRNPHVISIPVFSWHSLQGPDKTWVSCFINSQQKIGTSSKKINMTHWQSLSLSVSLRLFSGHSEQSMFRDECTQTGIKVI